MATYTFTHSAADATTCYEYGYAELGYYKNVGGTRTLLAVLDTIMFGGFGSGGQPVSLSVTLASTSLSTGNTISIKGTAYSDEGFDASTWGDYSPALGAGTLSTSATLGCQFGEDWNAVIRANTMYVVTTFTPSGGTPVITNALFFGAGF